MTDNLPEFDEFNNIRTTYSEEILGGSPGERINRKRCEDIIFDLMTMAYVYGLEVAGLDLEEDIPVDRRQMERLLSEPTAGKTAMERLNDYVAAANDELEAQRPQTDSTEIRQEIRQPAQIAETLVNDLTRLAETEAHRVMNETILEEALGYAKRHLGKNITKTWATMKDDRVREPHEWLEGSTVPLDAYFYSDGDKALAPGGFERADLNCNCRCLLRINK